MANSTATGSRKRVSKAFSAPVRARISAAAEGMNQLRRASGTSRRRKEAVKVRISVAIYRSAQAKPPDTRYPAAAPRAHITPPQPPPARAVMATPKGAPLPGIFTQAVTKPSAKWVARDAAFTAAGRLIRSPSPAMGLLQIIVLPSTDISVSSRDLVYIDYIM